MPTRRARPRERPRPDCGRCSMTPGPARRGLPQRLRRAPPLADRPRGRRGRPRRVRRRAAPRRGRAARTCDLRPRARRTRRRPDRGRDRLSRPEREAGVSPRARAGRLADCGGGRGARTVAGHPFRFASDLPGAGGCSRAGRRAARYRPRRSVPKSRSSSHAIAMHHRHRAHAVRHAGDLRHLRPLRAGWRRRRRPTPRSRGDLGPPPAGHRRRSRRTLGWPGHRRSRRGRRDRRLSLPRRRRHRGPRGLEGREPTDPQPSGSQEGHGESRDQGAEHDRSSGRAQRRGRRHQGAGRRDAVGRDRPGPLPGPARRRG